MSNGHNRSGTGTMVTLSIRLNPMVAEMVKDEAIRQGMSYSCYIRKIVLTALRSDGLLNDYDAAVDIDVPRSSGREGG